jgi:hypothetical protein
MDNVTLVFGIGGTLIILALLALVAWQNRQNGMLIGALTDTIQQVANNSKVVDLIEPLATKVVPVELVRQYDKGAEFVKSLTPDQFDRLIDSFTLFLHRSTDGLPNTGDVGTTG